MPPTQGLDFVDNELVSHDGRLRRGDRVRIRSNYREHRELQGRFGRIWYIHNLEEIHIQLDEAEQLSLAKDEATEALSRLIFVLHFDELEVNKPRWSGYLHKFAVSGVIRNWKRRFFEVWEGSVTFRDTEFSYEYKHEIFFNNNTTLIAPTSHTLYPFVFPVDVPSETGSPHIIIFKFDQNFLYSCTDSAQDAQEFSDAIAQGVDENSNS